MQIARLAALSRGKQRGWRCCWARTAGSRLLNGPIDEVLGTSAADALSVPFDYLVD